MAPPKTPAAKRRYYSVEEANKTLPLVKAIVADIVRQLRIVHDLEQRLSAVGSDRRKQSDDPYLEELAQTQTEKQAEQEKLDAYMEELDKLGVEFKGPDGLCDFYSQMDGRDIFLCWRLGEPEVMHWHELTAGFPGRKPLPSLAGRGTSSHSH